MTELRTRKGCAKLVGDTDSRPVGEWRFCDECFDKLFSQKKVQTDPPEPVVDLAEEDEDEEEPIQLGTLQFESAQRAEPTCRICEKPSADGTYVKVAGLSVCPACYAKMMPPSTIKKVKKEVEPEVPPEPLVIEPVGIRNLRCAACSRGITARGAKMRDERHYCPDCYVNLPPKEDAPEPAPEA